MSHPEPASREAPWPIGVGGDPGIGVEVGAQELATDVRTGALPLRRPPIAFGRSRGLSLKLRLLTP